MPVWFFLSFAVVLSVKFNYSASSDKRGLDEGVPKVEREACRLFEQLPRTNTTLQWPANEVSVAQKIQNKQITIIKKKSGGDELIRGGFYYLTLSLSLFVCVFALHTVSAV